uniref:Uncharacterized protein n=1 Tax=Podarcis muralis TaxID=64176 RepID=A0A670ITD2_PODMU
MVDSIYQTRSLGVAAEGLLDQYADGRTVRVWQLYIGNTQSCIAKYKNWLVWLLSHGSHKLAMSLYVTEEHIAV